MQSQPQAHSDDQPAKRGRGRPPGRAIPPEIRNLYILLEVPREDWYLPSGRIIAFCHALKVPAGIFVNKPLRLRDFQLDFIRDVYNPRQPDGRRLRRQAVLSVGRRAGKTLLAALLILIHLVGPCKRPNSTIVSAATTRKQASIIHKMVGRMVRANERLGRYLKVLDSSKVVLHRVDGSTYTAISADAGGAFGEGLDLVVYDELAQSKNNALYDALMTSLGSQAEPLMMIISTQAPSDDHILSELIDYGLKVRAGEFEDDSFTVHLYAANDNCNLMDEREWRRANPTLGDYRDATEFRQTMERATRVPSLEAVARNLYLNQRVAAKAPFLTAAVWKLGDGAVNEALLYDGRPVFAGLDLSARTDLSCLCLATEDDEGNVHLFPRIWTPDDTLDARALRDRAPYRVWANKDLIIPVPGQAIDYDFVAKEIGEVAGKSFLQKLAYDRWRIDVLKQSLARLGVYVESLLMDFGQGFKDMGPAVDTFEELALAGKLRHGGHPVLRWAVSNAVVVFDAANNRKLDKSKSNGRIDPAIGALQAVAAMKLQTENQVDLGALIG